MWEHNLFHNVKRKCNHRKNETLSTQTFLLTNSTELRQTYQRGATYVGLIKTWTLTSLQNDLPFTDEHQGFVTLHIIQCLFPQVHAVLFAKLLILTADIRLVF